MYEQYTDKQIVEMLRPKLTKIMNGMDGMWNTALEHSEGGRNLIKLIATIYRSAYIRGQLGRSFIIGEKKERAADIVFQIGDGVKLINKKGIDKKDNRYFPLIDTIGEVTEIGSDYCFVQWPDGTTADNGVWACRNKYLEKVSERWVPATRDNIKVGSKVRMIDDKGHRSKPWRFPDIRTVGIVTEVGFHTHLVQWPEGSTSRTDEWGCDDTHLEVLLCE